MRCKSITPHTSQATRTAAIRNTAKLNSVGGIIVWLIQYSGSSTATNSGWRSAFQCRRMHEIKMSENTSYPDMPRWL